MQTSDGVGCQTQTDDLFRRAVKSRVTHSAFCRHQSCWASRVNHTRFFTRKAIHLWSVKNREVSRTNNRLIQTAASRAEYSFGIFNKCMTFKFELWFKSFLYFRERLTAEISPHLKVQRSYFGSHAKQAARSSQWSKPWLNIVDWVTQTLKGCIYVCATLQLVTHQPGTKITITQKMYWRKQGFHMNYSCIYTSQHH